MRHRSTGMSDDFLLEKRDVCDAGHFYLRGGRMVPGKAILALLKLQSQAKVDASQHFLGFSPTQ